MVAKTISAGCSALRQTNMEKEILISLKDALASGVVTKAEVLALVDASHGENIEAKHDTQGTRIAHILYGTGGLIVFAGLCIFIGQHWDDFSGRTVLYRGG